MSIPKIIHYCWFGTKPLPQLEQKCIESWKKYFPDFEIKRWDESNFDISQCKYAQQAYDAGKFAFVSDYVRLKVLYDNGGIYFDTDVEVIRPFDDLLKEKGFMGFEKAKPTPNGRVYYVSTALGTGCEKHSEIIKAMLDDYNDISFIKSNGEYNITSCPVRNTNTLVKLGLKADGKDQKINGFRFYPTEYLCPIDFYTKKKKITNNTHAVHMYSGSWIDSEMKPSLLVKLQCTRIGMMLWRAKVDLLNMGATVSAVRNAVKFGCKKLFTGAYIKTNGRLLFGRDTKFKIDKRGSVILGSNIISDGRCTVIVEKGAKLSIGSDVYFNEGAMISCLKSVTIGDGTLFGPNVKIFDNNHKFSKNEGVSREHSTNPISIGKNCWIASNVTILKGVTIGDNCVIGAGCVISYDVPSGTKVTLKQQHQVVMIDDRQFKY